VTRVMVHILMIHICDVDAEIERRVIDAEIQC